MNYIEEIKKYTPINEQEKQDKKIFLEVIEKYKNKAITRECETAHLTSSSIILNEEHTKMLMIYHKIYDTWTWTGGHVDGDTDLLEVALKEAKEETGIKEFKIINGIKTLDILTVQGHIKKEKYVAPHLHLNIAYILEAKEQDELILNKEETKGIKWIDLKHVEKASGEKEIVYIFNKMLKKINLESVMLDVKEK